MGWWDIYVKIQIDTKRISKTVGIILIAFFFALLGWTFSLPWENKFIYIIVFIILGAILSSLD